MRIAAGMNAAVQFAQSSPAPARCLSSPPPSAARRRPDAGSVLLLVVFMAAAMLVAALATLPRVLIEGRRQKEAELVWRGDQYVRAIRLYYRKYGHFPRTIEDFSKNPGNIHFLRKDYKDPMNKTDGSWRYIYVGPGGQLIGSITRKLPLGLIPLGPGVPGAQGNQLGAGQGGFFGSNPPAIGQSTPGQSGAGQSTAQNVPGQPPTPPAPDDAGSLNPDDTTATPLPPAPVAPNQAIQGASTTDSTVFGGQLVGVASKVDRKSIRFYKGYGKYREWEFIWDPAEDAGAAGGLVPTPPGRQLPTGTPPVGTPPIGTGPTNPPQ
jgi:hypothetical protein